MASSIQCQEGACSSRCLREWGRDTCYGVAGAAVSVTAGYGAMAGSTYLLRSWGFRGALWTPFWLYESAKALRPPWVQTAVKLFSLLFVALIGPIAEEKIFRGLFYDWQESKGSVPDSRGARVERVLLNGVLFGLLHSRPLYGWALLPLILVSIVSGVVFASLREITGSHFAPTVAHCLNNTFVIGCYFL